MYKVFALHSYSKLKIRRKEMMNSFKNLIIWLKNTKQWNIEAIEIQIEPTEKVSQYLKKQQSL